MAPSSALADSASISVGWSSMPGEKCRARLLERINELPTKKRRDYITTWKSRMGEEAAGSAYDFRVLAALTGWTMLTLAGLGVLATVARAFPLAYASYGLVLLAVLPLTFFTIRSLHKALTVIRRRYGLPTGVRMPWSVLARTEAFDRWVLENRRG